MYFAGIDLLTCIWFETMAELQSIDIIEQELTSLLQIYQMLLQLLLVHRYLETIFV